MGSIHAFPHLFVFPYIQHKITQFLFEHARKLFYGFDENLGTLGDSMHCGEEQICN